MAEQSPSPPTASHTETPPTPQPRRRPRRPRAPGAYLRLPVWQRFVLAGVIAVVLLVAMVIFVEHNNTNTNRSLNEAAEVKANRDAVILVRQDQAPQLDAPASPPAAHTRPGAGDSWADGRADRHRRDRRAPEGRPVQGQRGPA